MTIDLDPDQYRKLIELSYLGEWLINAHHDPEHQDDAADSLVQKLLSAPGLPHVKRDDETGEYFMDDAWVAALYDHYILDYDDHVFWDELIERLAARDLARDRGIAAEDINRDDDLLDLRPMEERYRKELEEHGVDHLEVSGSNY